jgi:hypothetical protein
MEPAIADEDEFHAWYDAEHVPERQRVPGFETGLRFVCLDGWPRYLALYDLDDLAVLGDEPYQAISGERFSPWSKRVLSRVRGRYLAAATLVHPADGTATGGNGPCSRLVLLRFRNLPQELAETTFAALSRCYGEQSSLRQLRLFRFAAAHVVDHLAIVEINGAVPALTSTVLGPAAAYLDLNNVYAPYFQHEPLLVIPKRGPA